MFSVTPEFWGNQAKAWQQFLLDACVLNASRFKTTFFALFPVEKEKDQLMEIACIVTVTLDKTESIVIHLTDKSLDKMQEWCIKQHGRVRSAAPRSRGWCWICWPGRPAGAPWPAPL